MSWISASDPLALVYIQSGQIPTPNSEENPDAVNSELDVAQRAAKIGEPVPIVFARRRNNAGGVLISPAATECAFRNDAVPHTNITVFYHVVLGEGQMGAIPVKDLFHGPCRVGSHSQTYNRRAGTWDPGNFLAYWPGVAFPEASYYCGIVGNYPKMSTLSFEATYDITLGDFWKRQVHCFIRDGMFVTRLADSVFGPSDSFADLVKWVHENSARVPSALIDVPSFQAADTFLSVNGFTCNCNIKESQNVSDFLAKWAPYFLLKETRNGGKRGLRPLLPVTTGGAIDTSPITWKYSFTEDDIVAGSFEIQYSSLTDRQPFVVQAIWRQQLESDFGITRTAEVRYGGTAPDGPFESHDLSAFCTKELHAVKVGAYILSKRVRTTHAIRFIARPQAHNRLLSPGDIIHVQLKRQASAFAATEHDYLYQVERITRTLAGEVRYEAVHFPVDSQGRSLLALDVAAATPTGSLLPSNKTGLGCDLNSALDNTVPPETWRYGSGGDAPTSLSYSVPTEPDRVPISSDDGLDLPYAPLLKKKSPNIEGLEYAEVDFLCPDGSVPQKIEWEIKGKRSGDFLPLPGVTGNKFALTPLPVGADVIGYVEITSGDGSRNSDYFLRSVYYCGDKRFVTSPVEYTGSPSGLSYAYFARPVRQSDYCLGNPYAYLFDPTKPMCLGFAYHFLYHNVVYTGGGYGAGNGDVRGYTNQQIDYFDLLTTGSPAPNWSVAGGPDVVAAWVVSAYAGPTASLGLGSMSILPPNFKSIW